MRDGHHPHMPHDIPSGGHPIRHGIAAAVVLRLCWWALERWPLALGLVAGFHLNALERLGARALADLGKPVMSKREQFRLCSLSLTEAEANPIPTNEELEWLLVRRQARYA